MSRIRVIIVFFLLCQASLVLVSIGGCGHRQGEIFPATDPPLVWPKPPESPRIKYLGQLTGEKDLKRGISSVEVFRRAVFGRAAEGVLLSPYGITGANQGDLYIADTTAGVVHKLGLRSRSYLQFNSLAGNEKLHTPVAVVWADGRVYVADSFRKQICVFTSEGQFVFSFGDDILLRPAGLAYSTARSVLYVADAAQHVIYLFTPKGKFMTFIGRRGSGEGEFNFPTHLWIDAEDKLYVSDTLNYRVQVFSPEGMFLYMFGRQGDRPGCFAHPSGIATDRFGHIYVVDRQFENVQIFDRQGNILMAFGGEGRQAGNFWLPAGIWIDKNNHIYIADSYNKRIQVFTLLEVTEP